jgi:molybdopterin-guanine dinucleotide biosynthesis protein A
MDFSAALLAGGRSSRMGRDKAFLEIDGVPLWQRQLRTLQELDPSEIFVAGPAQQEWMETGLKIVADAVYDSGPLGGLVALLRRSRTEQLLVLAVDLPNMTSQFLKELLTDCPKTGGIVPKRNKRFEPLAAIYSAGCLVLAESCLNSGNCSLQQLARRAAKAGLVTTREIADAEESLFFNLNTPADFAAIAKK